MCELKITGFVAESIVDGPGIRAVVFVQGCPRRCPCCHNPEAQPFEGGETRTIEDIFASLRRNPLITGVTFSGGEPFCQANALAELAYLIKPLGLEVAVYTGYLFEELINMADPDVHALLKASDILIDGPYEQAQRSLSLRFRGSKNQRIIDLPASLLAGRAVLDTTERWNGD